MPAITFDLWHTLVYLDPASEEAYMEAQVEIAGHSLAKSPRLRGAPELSEAELGHAFERVFAQAIAEAGQGRTVTQVQQLTPAGRATGRVPEIDGYLRDLELTVTDP